MFTQLTSNTIQEPFEKYVCNQSSHYNTNSATRPNYRLKLKYPLAFTLLCQLCLTCYTVVRINNRLKSTSVIKIATMKSTDNSGFP